MDITNSNVKNHRGLIFVISKYKKTHLAEIGASPRTKKNYDVFTNNLIGFISTRTEILVDEVDIDFGLEYKDYLSGYIESITHVSRNIEFLKAALEHAVDLDLILKNPLRKFKAKRDEVPEITFLTKEEIHHYYSYKGELQQTKDMFTLQCLTGMSYGDLWSYEIHNDKGQEWIYNKRNKNQKRYWIPLDPIAKEIAERYNLRFPFINNRIYNDQIREIAEAQGITKHLTSHVARKTFATLMNVDGWPHECIADMMGIAIPTMTKHYINKSKMRIEAELKERLKRMVV